MPGKKEEFLEQLKKNVKVQIKAARDLAWLRRTEAGHQITLAEMRPKDKGVVVKMTRRGTVTRRLVEMGVVKGAVVEVERIAPLGDPIDVKIRGYHLSLRKEEAANIIVTPL